MKDYSKQLATSKKLYNSLYVERTGREMTPKNYIITKEITITEVLIILRKYIYPITIIPLIVAFAAFFFYLKQPLFWQGTALVKIGRTPLTAQLAGSVDIESLEVIMARLTTPAFRENVIKQIEKDNHSIEIEKSLKDFKISATPHKDTGLLQLTIKSSSNVATKLLLPKVFETLSNQQALELKPINDFFDKKVQKLTNESKILRAEIQKLQSTLDKEPAHNTSKIGTLTLEIKDKKSVLRDVEKDIFLAEGKLIPAASFPAKLVGDYSFADEPTKSKNLWGTLIPIILSLLITLSIVFLIEILKYQYSKIDNR